MSARHNKMSYGEWANENEGCVAASPLVKSKERLFVCDLWPENLKSGINIKACSHALQLELWLKFFTSAESAMAKLPQD